jgi:tripartite-type tricarboxylate transporter receptor subunit TctC
MRVPVMIFSAAVVLLNPAFAQDWPTRPMTLIVPFVAGGPIDVVARIQGQRIGEILGQSVVVENVGGAAGTTGALRVAKAPPDGYQFVVGNVGTHAYSQTLYKKPPYDAVNDFTPVGLTTDSPRVFMVRKDLPVNTLAEFMAYAKANHAKMQFGSAGVGSATHVPCLLITARAGVTITHIPYRGAAPAMQDLIGGRVDFMCDSIQTAMPQILERNVKAIAILAPTRAAVLPDVPTAEEQGFAGLEASAWNGIFLPKGTPEPIVRRLNKATNEALESPAIRDRLDNLGLTIVPADKRTPEYLAAFVRSEIERWAGPIKAAGISAD